MRSLFVVTAVTVFSSSLAIAQAPGGTTWAWKPIQGQMANTPTFATIIGDAQARTNLLEATGEVTFPNDKQYTVTKCKFSLYIDQGGGIWNPVPDIKIDDNTTYAQVVQNKWKLTGYDDNIPKLKLVRTVDVKLEFEVEYTWAQQQGQPAPVKKTFTAATWINKPVP